MNRSIVVNIRISVNGKAIDKCSARNFEWMQTIFAAKNTTAPPANIKDMSCYP